MMPRKAYLRWAICLSMICCASDVSQALAAPPTAAERAKVKQASDVLSKAGNLYRAKKYQECAQNARTVLELLSDLPADDSKPWQELLDPLGKQLTKARELLATQNIEIPAWRMPGEAGSATSVSFVRQVAPLLLDKCGGCHVQKSEGELSMATFAALKKGSSAGVVYLPRDSQGSRLIELIEAGDMPRGDGKISTQELATLKAWISAGAAFDGPDEFAPLTSLVPGATQAMAPPVQVVAAGANDEVQFARDIGPILLTHCSECHNEENNGNGLSMESYAGFIRGGGNGPPLVAGKAAESLLLKKLLGTAGGDRMPQGRDPLAAEVIAKVEKWVAIGAKFDGDDAALPLATIVAQRSASELDHLQLSKQRLELADRTWRLILPDTKANRVESDNVLVVGGLEEETLAAVAKTAEEQVAKLRRMFKVPDEQPLIKGRLTLFVFDKRYDYGEVGTMLERREIPASWRGHWVYNPLDPYGCILLSEEGEAPSGLVAQQIAGVYVSGLGKVPRWFAEGSARAIASRLDPKDPRVKQWDDQAAEVLSTAERPEEFLAGSLEPEDSDVLSYSFVSKLLMSPAGRYLGMLSALQSGTSFDQAFAKAYGNTPAEVVPSWTPRVNKRRR
jgi:mono/diheme cytochrome c family protein